MFDFDSTEENSSNYPTEPDTAYTPDEQEAIKKYKDNLTKKIDKNRSILKGFEAAFWATTSYSLARFLILTAGSGALTFAAASVFVINNIVNRDLLDGFRFDRKEGENQIEGMGKLIRFALSTAGTAFILWSSIGDFYHVYHSSHETYDNIHKTVEDFQKLPQDNQNKLIIVGGVVALAGLWVVVDSKKK